MEPKIMKFQTSQKLLNPNLSSVGTHIERMNISPLEQNKLKILVKLFVDKNQWKNVKLEFEEQLSLQQLTPIIFEQAELSSEIYDLQSIDVLDKKSDEYITVNDEYLLQTFDKFQVHLVKKEQHLETVAIISQSENEEQQKLSIDTSEVKTIKQLSEFLSTQLNIKNGNIVIQKFDDDFGENIDVDEEDKFDPTKTYNIQVTKVLKFDILVAPELEADLSGEKDETNGLRPKIKETGFPAFSVNASRNISLNTSGGFPAPLNPNKYAPSVEVNEPGFSGDTSSRYSSRGSSYVNSSHDTSIRNSTPTPPPRKSKNVQSFNGDGASPNTGFSPLNNREGSSSRNYVLPPEIIFRTPPPPVNAAVAKGSVTPVKFAAPVKRNESAPEPAPSATTFSAPKIDPKKVAFKSGFKDILQLYLNKSSNIDEVVHSLIEYISNYSNPTFCLEQIFAYCCEDIKYDCGKERNDASKLLLKCLQQNSALKNAFSVAFKNYCKYIVKYNIEQNQVNLILTFPNFFAHLLANNSSKIIPINAFIDGFKQFHAAGSLMFARTFAEFGRVYKPQDQFNVGARMGMLYHEFCALDPYYKSKEIQIILEKNLFKYDRYNNLKTLLDSMNCFKNFVDY